MLLLLLSLLTSGIEYQSSYVVGGDFRDAASDDSLLYVADGRGVRILGQKRFTEAGGCLIPGRNYLVALYSDTLYIGGDRGLCKLTKNLINNSKPKVEWIHDEPMAALAISSDTLFYADIMGNLYLKHIPSNTIMDSFKLTYPPLKIRTFDSKVFLPSDSGGLWIIDLGTSSPKPKHLDIEDSPPVMDLLADGELIYLACAEEGLRACRLKRNSLKVLSAVESPGQLFELAGFGDRLAVAAGTGDFLLYSLADPAEPALIQQEPLKGTAYSLVSGHDACFTLSGSVIVKMKMKSSPAATLGKHYRIQGVGHDVVSKGTIAVLSAGEAGLINFIVRDSIERLGDFDFDDDCRSLFLFTSHVFTLSASNTLHVADIKDPHKPERKSIKKFKSVVTGLDVAGEMILVAEQADGLGSWWRCPCGPIKEQGRLKLPGRTLDVSISEKLAFVSTDFPTTLHLIDWTDSTNLELVNSAEMDRSYERLYLSDDILIGLDREGILDVFNVSRPTRVKKLSELILEGSLEALTIAGEFIYIAAGNKGVHKIDFSKPANPSLVETFDIGYVSGVAVSNGLLFAATPYGLEAFEIQ